MMEGINDYLDGLCRILIAVKESVIYPLDLS